METAIRTFTWAVHVNMFILGDKINATRKEQLDWSTRPKCSESSSQQEGGCSFRPAQLVFSALWCLYPELQQTAKLSGEEA